MTAVRSLIRKLAARGIVLACILTLAACVGTAPGQTVRVTGRATAGPVCPVERPGDPACAPRAVAGAVLVVSRSGGGPEVARATTAADGTFTLDLAAGAYTLTPQPVAGLIGGAQPIEFSVATGARPTALAVAYDTGIR